ncbi:MAG TPA: carboxypeptidase regulatory-like domain-containing protein [Terriglobia bacterium]
MLLHAMVLAGLLAQNGTQVEGFVKRAGTNEPVPRAIVELHRDSDDSIEYTVSSGDDGKYAVRNVRPGKYRIVANKAGYVRAEYGQRAPGKGGTALEFAAGRNVAGLDLALTATAAISGRIYDVNGLPVVKATVRALKPSFQNGQRTFTPVQAALTNDLGEYRLFWLAPGRYFVGVNAPDWRGLGDLVLVNSSGSIASGAMNGQRFGTPLENPLAPVTVPRGFVMAGGTYMPIYYPNTADEQAAEAVNLAPGASIEGVDIRLAPVRTRRVRGVVIDSATGRPFVNPTPGYANSVQAAPRTDSSAQDIINPTTGAFEIPVVAGPAVLSVAGYTRTGSVRIPAGDTDLDGVQIVVSSGFQIHGQILLDGVNPAARDPRIASLRVRLRAAPQAHMIEPPATSGVPSATGEFAIQNVTTGDYRIDVAPVLTTTGNPSIPAALQNAYVKSIRIGNDDILSGGFQADTQPPDSPMVIVVGLNAGSISGTVVAENQMPAPDATVVLVPDGDRRQRQDLYRTGTSDTSAHFKFDRISPGSYKLFAWDNVDNGVWLDPAFMKANEDSGKSIVIREGSREEIQLSVRIP